MDFATVPKFQRVAVAREVSNLTFGKVETAVGRVSVFDVRSHRVESEFGVRYDAGGKRLCLSRDGSSIVCGCYEVYGLGAYDLAGTERWRRKDLKGVQFVQTVFGGDYVFCGRNRGAGEIVCIRTGESVQKLRGAKEFFASSFSSHTLLVGAAYQLHARLGVKHFQIQPQTFGVLDAAFTPEVVSVSEATGPLRAFSLGTGEQLWSHMPEMGSHFLYVAPTSSDSFVALLRCYQDKGVADAFVHFDAKLGAVVRDVSLPGRISGCFCLAGSAFFTSELQLLSTHSGEKSHDFGHTAA